MMIEVNLMPGRQAKGPGFKLPDFKSLFVGVQNPWAFAAAVVWAVVLAAVAATFIKQSSQARRLSDQLDSASVEYDRFATIYEAKQAAEQARDMVLAQIDAIKEIDSERYIWAHILEEVSRAVPDLTWLTFISEVQRPVADTTQTATPMTVSIQGQTLDVQAYTRFQRNLEASAWLSNVSGTSFATAFTNDNRPVTTFNLVVEFRRADSSLIRTVPLLESVR